MVYKDEKEALRKQEQKREIGLKRAAQQEEALRRERQQHQEAEKQREKERSAMNEDPKRIAQKQAIEKRRLELKQKDQQRSIQRPVNDLVSFYFSPWISNTHLHRLMFCNKTSLMHQYLNDQISVELEFLQG